MRSYFKNMVAQVALLAQKPQNPLVEQVSGLFRFGTTLAQLALSKKLVPLMPNLCHLNATLKPALPLGCATNATNATNNFKI